MMSVPEIIDLSSDDETESNDIKDVKPTLTSTIYNEKENRFSIVDFGDLAEQKFQPLSTFRGSYAPLCRQFWKSGDYDVGHALGQLPRNGQNRLRIHPKFLHSNATSHKWAFGAIAELLDNAVDEVQNGATFVIVDNFTNPCNGDPALLIQDNGGGMDPDSLRRCMSFGFSDKQSGSTIGQYGNGFKTSTMRLGADVIVFSRCMKSDSKSTQSIGLLSYTFLKQTGCDDIVVPVVDYDFKPATGAFVHLFRIDEKQFSSNLTTLLNWSPFTTEAELLKQFDDIGHHGTKIIVFNLWYNDDGIMELDFKTDTEDILITGGQKKVQKVTIEAELSLKCVASRYQYSLRIYSSILYLKLPHHFKILLRGLVVEPHHIIKDLMYIECIRYRPQIDIRQEVTVDTTIGFLKGAPNVNVHGFNVYHKNRLIVPFWRVAHNSYGKGRGVVGVLEANFIKPTHDKQDFERSSIYQKLEVRLKEMTYEYWDLYCHLVGYQNRKLSPSCTKSVLELPPADTSGALEPLKLKKGIAEVGKSPATQSLVALNTTSFPPGMAQKRKRDILSSVLESLRKRNGPHATVDGPVGHHKAKPEHVTVEKKTQKIEALLQENKKLHEQSLEYEEIEKQLSLKVEKLRNELRQVEGLNEKLLAELKLIDAVKMDKP